MSNSNPLNYIAEMRKLVLPDKQSEFMEMLRQFNTVTLVHFRINQLNANTRQGQGEFTDGTGDRYLVECINTLPPETAKEVFTDYVEAILRHFRMSRQEATALIGGHK